MEKQELRKIMKEKRENLSQEECDFLGQQIEGKLYSFSTFRHTQTIYLYIAYQKEVETKNIINTCFQLKKQVAVPKVIGRKIEFFAISCFSDLVSGYQGILEPKKEIPVKKSKALMLIPGLAFDLDYNRLGYGGGFYDQYLREHKTDYFDKVALAYDFQIVEKLKVDIQDEKVDKIITPSRIL